MTTVAIVLHGDRPEAVEVAAAVAAWLEQRGHRVVAGPDEGAQLRSTGLAVPAADGASETVGLVIAVGGDGTMLRAARRAVEADADVLGINLGQLGYLTEVEPNAWERALDTYFQGRHGITARLLVAAHAHLPGAEAPQAFPSALNEVVIEKQAMGRTVHLGVSIDGEFFTSYVADGVIIATPTGSTAYSLSARGPVVAPTHRALILTAVSPHSLFDRSLVLEPSSTVEVEVLDDRSAGLSADGELVAELPPGSKVAVTAADRPARFVTFGGGDFHHTLKAKFGLNDR